MIEHFKILNSKVTDSLESIKKEYIKLVKIHHPDKGGKEEVFTKINNAWAYISENYNNPEKMKDLELESKILFENPKIKKIVRADISANTIPDLIAISILSIITEGSTVRSFYVNTGSIITSKLGADSENYNYDRNKKELITIRNYQGSFDDIKTTIRFINKEVCLIANIELPILSYIKDDLVKIYNQEEDIVVEVMNMDEVPFINFLLKGEIEIPVLNKDEKERIVEGLGLRSRKRLGDLKIINNHQERKEKGLTLGNLENDIITPIVLLFAMAVLNMIIQCF